MSADEKTQFIDNVKKWVALEKHLKLVNEQAKHIRAQKADLGDKICDYMNARSISHKPIELSDGAIVIGEKREYTPLSFSYIEDCLEALIEDKSHVDAIMDYIHEHRDVRVVSELKRTYAAK